MQHSNGGRAALLVALVGLAAGGSYFALARGDGEHAEEVELATDARSAPRSSRSPRARSTGDGDTEAAVDPRRAARDRSRRPSTHRDTNETLGESSPSETMVRVGDAGARALPIPASRRPVATPTARPEQTRPVPADVRLRSSEALERIAEQRVAELTEQLTQARRNGHTARAAHIERTIARIRAQQPRIREHVEATRREVEAATDEPDTEEARSDTPESDQASAP